MSHFALLVVVSCCDAGLIDSIDARDRGYLGSYIQVHGAYGHGLHNISSSFPWSAALFLIPGILGAVFSNRDLDPLARKYLAQWRALNHARKLLGTIYFKCITVGCCQYRCLARSNINQTAFQTEVTRRPHTEVLQHEPEAQLALVVIQLERVDR